LCRALGWSFDQKVCNLLIGVHHTTTVITSVVVINLAQAFSPECTRQNSCSTAAAKEGSIHFWQLQMRAH
jgi:hypothetical protein